MAIVALIRILMVLGFAEGTTLVRTRTPTALGSVVVLTQAHIKTLMARGLLAVRILVLTKIQMVHGSVVALIQAHIKTQTARGLLAEHILVHIRTLMAPGFVHSASNKPLEPIAYAPAQLIVRESKKWHLKLQRH